MADTKGFGKWSYELLSYILLVIVFVMYMMMHFYKSERYVTAGICLILFILIFTFFGLRWFQNGLSYTGEYKGKWPPIINTCPDYLSLWKDSTNAIKCVDRIGISTRKEILQTWTDVNVTPSPGQIFNSPYIPSNTRTKAQFLILKTAAETAGLSWEGITDGAYTNWAE